MKNLSQCRQLVIPIYVLEMHCTVATAMLGKLLVVGKCRGKRMYSLRHLKREPTRLKPVLASH